jgi:hypothetical protein
MCKIIGVMEYWNIAVLGLTPHSKRFRTVVIPNEVRDLSFAR